MRRFEKVVWNYYRENISSGVITIPIGSSNYRVHCIRCDITLGFVSTNNDWTVDKTAILLLGQTSNDFSTLFNFIFQVGSNSAPAGANIIYAKSVTKENFILEVRDGRTYIDLNLYDEDSVSNLLYIEMEYVEKIVS